MGLNDAGRLINIIRDTIRRETKSGAMIEHSYGQIATNSGGTVSAYLNGNYDEASDGFRIPAGIKANVGDYGHFAVDHGRGSKWIAEVLPNSLYSRIVLDVNDGQMYTGDGLTPPETPVTDFVWEGTEFVFEDNGIEDEMIWS